VFYFCIISGDSAAFGQKALQNFGWFLVCLQERNWTKGWGLRLLAWL